MSSELATQSKSALSVWSLETTQQKIQSLVPKSLEWERFKRLATSLINRNPKIAECEPVSLMSVFSDCAVIGVYPDPVTGKAYIIPRFNKKKQVLEATLLVGYKGLRDIALRSPDILDLWTGVVRQGDTFKMVRAPRMDLIHEPLPEESGEVIGCYSIATLRNGLTNFEWMPVGDLNKIKAGALNGQEDWKRDQSPWTLHETEMNRKTVLRRHFKSLPLRAEDQESAAREVDVELEKEDVRETFSAPEVLKRPAPPARSNKGTAAIVENAEPAAPAAIEVTTTETPVAQTPEPTKETPKVLPERIMKNEEVAVIVGKVVKLDPTPKGNMLAIVETADASFGLYHKGEAANPTWKLGAELQVSVKGVADNKGKIVNFVTAVKAASESIDE